LTAGVLAVLGSVLAGRLILAGRGFVPAYGPSDPRTSPSLLSLAHGPVLRAAAGSVLYLALIGMLSLGTAAAVRDPAAAIGVVLGLLYLFPIATAAVSDPHWHRLLEQVAR
jgi:ABC-2 type transport system permease protein